MNRTTFEWAESRWKPVLLGVDISTFFKRKTNPTRYQI